MGEKDVSCPVNVGKQVSIQKGKSKNDLSHRAAVLEFKDFFKLFLESIEFDS